MPDTTIGPMAYGHNEDNLLVDHRFISATIRHLRLLVTIETHDCEHHRMKMKPPHHTTPQVCCSATLEPAFMSCVLLWGLGVEVSLMHQAPSNQGRWHPK
jgi:hypothetical protein